jgi:hypothetical protein
VFKIMAYPNIGLTVSSGLRNVLVIGVLTS